MIDILMTVISGKNAFKFNSALGMWVNSIATQPEVAATENTFTRATLISFGGSEDNPTEHASNEGVSWSAIGTALQAMELQSKSISERKALLEKAAAQYNVEPLHGLAWACGHLEVMEAFYELGWDFTQNQSADKPFVPLGFAAGSLNFPRQSPLLMAIEHNQTSALEWALNHGLSPEYKTTHPLVDDFVALGSPANFFDKNMPLFPLGALAWSLYLGRYESADFLWSKDEFRKDQYGLDTALYSLIHRLGEIGPHKEATVCALWLNRLIDAGANPHAKFHIRHVRSSEIYHGSDAGLADLLDLNKAGLETTGRSYKQIKKVGARRLDEFEEQQSAAQAWWKFPGSVDCGQGKRQSTELREASVALTHRMPSKDFEKFAIQAIQQVYRNLDRHFVGSGHPTSNHQIIAWSNWMSDPLLWAQHAQPSWLDLHKDKEPFCLWLDLVGLESSIRHLSINFKTYVDFANEIQGITEAVFEQLELSEEHITRTIDRATRDHIADLNFNPLKLGVFQKIFASLTQQTEIQQWVDQRQKWLSDQEVPNQQEKEMREMHAAQFPFIVEKALKHISAKPVMRRL